MSGDSALRIVVSGFVVRGPLAGPTWHHLQYVAGLADLGHDVWFVEDNGDYAPCYDPLRDVADGDPRYGLAYAARVFDRIGLGARWAYHDSASGAWHGPAAGGIVERCRSADVWINVSGINPLRPWTERIPLRILVDTDPVFTQIDVLRDPARRRFAEAHNAFFSFGESFGLAGCSTPDDGLPWQATRQPVVTRLWQPSPGPADGRYSTVMLWDSYDRREWDGRTYGMKSQEMERFVALPARRGERFEVALGSPSAPHDRLRALGWRVPDPLALTRDPWVYQDYMRASKAEFSVAKHGYVATACGWFSERSAGYLACGRPVVVQDTGFSRHLPTGAGLLAFADLDEAVAAIDDVDARYAWHCRAARQLVEAHFDAGVVLSRLLDAAQRQPPPQPGSPP
jgi:hypothetical protein